VNSGAADNGVVGEEFIGESTKPDMVVAVMRGDGRRFLSIRRLPKVGRVLSVSVLRLASRLRLLIGVSPGVTEGLAATG